MKAKLVGPPHKIWCCRLAPLLQPGELGIYWRRAPCFQLQNFRNCLIEAKVPEEPWGEKKKPTVAPEEFGKVVPKGAQGLPPVVGEQRTPKGAGLL